jgi:hypothetical protein
MVQGKRKSEAIGKFGKLQCDERMSRIEAVYTRFEQGA